MPQLLLLLSPCLCWVAVDVTQLDGTLVTGELVRWDGTQLAIETEDRTVELSTEQVLRVTFRDFHEPAKPRTKKVVTLRCGTTLPLFEFLSEDGRATLRLQPDAPPVKLDISQISSVRFHPASVAIDEQWQQLTAQQHQGDVIVIRKSDDALDYLEGIIGDVSSEQLQFELDEDRLEVALAKLEGIIPFGGRVSDTASSLCQLRTRDGAEWQVDQATLEQDSVAIRTPTGLATRISLSDISQISFAAGNVQYISDLQPVSANTTPLISGSETPDSVTRLLYAFRRDESLQGTPLMLVGGDGRRQVYQKGLAVHSKTVLQYRLAGEFRKLRGLCGIDPSIRSAATVSLTILADDQPVFDQSVTAGSAPVTIDVPIEGAARLRLVVDYADGSDIGDHLHLCNLRATK